MQMVWSCQATSQPPLLLLQLETGSPVPLELLDHEGHLCQDWKRSNILFMHMCLCVCAFLYYTYIG